MSLRRRIITLPGALVAGLAVLLALLAVPAQPARADVDMEVVYESVTEQGYYIDSAARYMRTDRSVEALRSGVETSGPVFVAVLPAGENAATRVRQLARRVGRNATYVVLAGGTLRAISSKLPATRIKQAYGGAVRASGGRPDQALINFLQNLPLEPGAKTTRRPTKTGKTPSARPERAAPADPQAGDQQAAPASSKKKASGGGPSMLLILLLVLVVLALGGGGGVLFWRRKQQAAPRPPGPLYQGAPQPPPPGRPIPGQHVAGPPPGGFPPGPPPAPPASPPQGP